MTDSILTLYRCGQCARAVKTPTKVVRIREWKERPGFTGNYVDTTKALCSTCYAEVRNGSKPYTTDQDAQPPPSDP